MSVSILHRIMRHVSKRFTYNNEACVWSRDRIEKHRPTDTVK